jgi:thermitase
MKINTKIIITLSVFVISIIGTSNIDSFAQSNQISRPTIVKFKNQEGVKKFKLSNKKKFTKESITSFSEIQLTDNEISKLQQSQDVEYVEIDKRMSPQLESVTYQEASVNAPLARSKMDSVSTKTLVGVCDSGVEGTHPDLQENIRKDLGYDVFNNSKTGWDTVQSPHGTMVSGVIAATANNDIGTRGVATKVEIMPLKMTFDATGDAYISTMARCIRYAVDNGAKVVNVSYSGMSSYAVQDAAAYAIRKNVNVVFAIGNENRLLFDRNNSNIIAVGATDSNNQRAYFSNYGRSIDVVAPGVAILTTTTGGGYAKVSGTSFSSPISAGIIAMARGKNPALTATKVISSLSSYTDDLGVFGYDNTYGFGIINANKTIQ